MNFRLTIILTVVLLVAFGTWLAVANRQATVAPTAATATPLFTPKPGDITAIAVTRYGEEIKFIKQDDQWKIAGTRTFNADNNKLKTIADTLASLGYRQKFSPDSSPTHTAQATGTDKPHYTVKFSDNAHHDYTLALGKRGTDGIFATVGGDSAIYVLSENPLDTLDQDADQFRNTDIKQIDTAKLAEVSLQAKDNAWKLTKSGDKWMISAPASARANATAVEELLKSLQQIRAQSFSDLSKKDTGLEPPLVTITAMVQSGPSSPASMPATAPASASQPAATPVTLQLGYPTNLTLDKKDSPVYASLAGSDEVFVLDNAAVKKINRELKDLRDPSVTPAAVTTATDMAVSVDGAPTVTVTKKDDAWTLNVPGATATLHGDAMAIGDYLGVIHDLRAIKFVDNAGDLKSIGLDPPHMKIELTLPGQSQHEILLVGKPETADKVTPVMRQGEPTVYLLQTAVADKLTTSPIALRDRMIEQLNADKIRKIEIAGRAATAGVGPASPASAPATGAPAATAPATPGVTLERDGTHWAIKKDAATLTPDDSKLSSLLADFTPLSAMKYASETVESGTPAVTVTVAFLESTLNTPATTPASAPAAASAPATASAPAATQPKLADVLPKADIIAPDPGKLVTRTLRLFKHDANNTTTWTAVWDGQMPAWSFEPTVALIDHLTKDTYTPTPATAPAVQPVEK